MSANVFFEVTGIPQRGRVLLTEINKGFSYSKLELVSKSSGFSTPEVSSIIGLTKNTRSRRKKVNKLSSDESDKLYRFTEVFQAALDLFEGDSEAAHAWMKSPVVGLGEEAPVSLLRTSAGSEMVLDLIGRLEHGVFS